MKRIINHHRLVWIGILFILLLAYQNYQIIEDFRELRRVMLEERIGNKIEPVNQIEYAGVSATRQSVNWCRHFIEDFFIRIDQCLNGLNELVTKLIQRII